MTIWISQDILLFKFEPLGILWDRIGHPCEKLWQFEFLESFRRLISCVSIYYKPQSDICVKSYDHLNFSRASVVQFRESRYIMSPNRTSVWEDRTIWISREPLLFNFERLNILWIAHPSERLWAFEFLEGIRYSISCVSIYYVSNSDIYLKR